MRVGIISAFVDYHRRGAHHRGALQPQIGPLLAALLPAHVQVEIINDTWDDPDWSRDYDLLFLSALHSDFDRARQISHYWRRRGAATVFGGSMASTYPDLCAPWFDAVVVGDPEDTVPRLVHDFERGQLQPRYRSSTQSSFAVPTPRADLVARQQVLPLALEVTRGCPFSCSFCVLSAVGTRFATRSVASVIRDLQHLRTAIGAQVPWYRQGMVVFHDNNIAGDLYYLRALTQALEPLGIRWGACISFNAAADARVIRDLARSGCRFLYVGLESFNPRTLAAMNKRHNAVHKTRDMVELCHRHGILLDAGLMLSPENDDPAYLAAIPELLDACGLIVPSYVCFETPIPGTPLFARISKLAEPRLLPNALLRDFTTYTLVSRPQHASADEFIEAYRHLLATVFSPTRRARKLLTDAARMLPHGGWFASALNVCDQFSQTYRFDTGRTYLAGTDREPPETQRIPFTKDDFRDESEYRAVMEPCAVTDSLGKVLAHWQQPTKLYTRQRARTPVLPAASPPSSSSIALQLILENQ